MLLLMVAIIPNEANVPPRSWSDSFDPGFAAEGEEFFV
jgi:hypothetical protein